MKKILSLLLAAAMALSLMACGGGNDSPAADKTDAPAPASDSVEPTDTPEPEDTPEPGPSATPVEIGGSIDNDNFLMTFESMELLDEYKYKTSEYSSTSLYVEDGYKLVVVKGHFENKATSAISDSAFALSALVNGTYEVDGHDVRFHFIRDKYFEIDPYTDLDYVMYINIPNKLAEQFETAEFSIGFKDDLSLITTTYDIDGNKTTDINQLYTLSGTAGAAAPAGGEGEAPAQTKGIWMLDYYVDNFNQPTDQWYITNSDYFTGTFSNSATTNSKLLVQVAADDEDGGRVAIFLYEYGRSLVKNSSSSYVDEYNLTMRTPDGTDHQLTGTMYCGDQRIYVDDAYVGTVMEAMKGEGTLSFYIEKADRTTSTYLFSFEADNFGALYESTAG